MILLLFIFFLGFIGTTLAIPLFKNLLIKSNLIRPNYRGENIPVGMGIVFLPMLIINSITILYFDYENPLYLFLFLFSIISMFLAGALDDIIGNRDVSGLKGHFKNLFKGNLTTGGFKAVFGGFVGVLVSVCISKNVFDIIINTLIIALSTNLMNLFDLRPGRAIKVYLIIIFVILFNVIDHQIRYLIMLILPNVLAYFNYDLKAKAMMGDTGSNVLGISIGVIFALSFPFSIRICWLLFLVFIHILTEKYSLTKIIENNKLLNYIDKLGR